MLFVIDVVLQYVRGKRAAGLETTLYYGLNSSLALGQVIFGLLCLWLTWTRPEILSRGPISILSILAGIGWLTITLLFIEYREPKIVMVVYMLLIIGAVTTG